MVTDRTIRALVEAGAVKRIRIVAYGGRFHVEMHTAGGELRASTNRGRVKTWVSLDAAAHWVQSMGLGRATLDLERWQPGQRVMHLDRGARMSPRDAAVR